MISMLLLGIDTSGKAGGVTLAQKDGGAFRVLRSSPIEGGTFSAQLIPTIEKLLREHQLNIHQVAGFAVASGPGSFTGLRVGLSAVKALSEALGKPIAMVSVLEALAISAGKNGRVAVALDAKRNEIFYGLYDVEGQRASRLGEALLIQDEFLSELESARPTCVAVADNEVQQIAATSTVAVKLLDMPGSEQIAVIGAEKLLAGETVSLETLDANYLRSSDAEIFFKG